VSPWRSGAGFADWDLVAKIADALRIPVFGSGDCVEPAQIIDRLSSGVEGVLVGRGVLRNPWILAQAADIAAGRTPRQVSRADRGRFLLDYIALLQDERVREPEGFRHALARQPPASGVSHDRWVVNKIRALSSWYTKGLEGGSQLRTDVNACESLERLQDLIVAFFAAESEPSVASHA